MTEPRMNLHHGTKWILERWLDEMDTGHWKLETGEDRPAATHCEPASGTVELNGLPFTVVLPLSFQSATADYYYRNRRI